MRATLAVAAASVIVFLAGWIIDDGLRGEHIPRGVEVDATPIGGLSREDAAAQLSALPRLQNAMTIEWNDASLSAPAEMLGVGVDVDATLNDASSRGGITRPFRWLSSLVSDRVVDPRFVLDRSTLATRLGEGDDAVFLYDPDGPKVALIDGVFVSADAAEIPIVDIDELERLLLAAVAEGTTAPILIPTRGTESVDVGGSALAAAANDLTAGGLAVSLVGDLDRYVIPERVLREWVRFDTDGEITLDGGAIISTLEGLFIGVGDLGEQATFFIDFLGGIHLVGGAPGNICCTDDTPDRVLSGLIDDIDIIDVWPKEDPDARGVAWAESLGITDLVGEFTTNFKPGQTRVTNIARIAELTRGAIIEPGETFSVNDYIGRRTTENGFVSAGVIANGVFSASVGGGISQYATTMFNAAFFAGLDFGVYQSHSIYISRYPYGREATVSFPNPDLQLVNNTPYGVLLWPTTTDDSITVRIYSTPWVTGEQTGQTTRSEGAACTRVNTERTRTWVDGHTEIDFVTARYRPEGIACNGSSSVPTTTTTTTVPPSTTTTVPPSTTSTTTLAPSTTTVAPSTTTTVPPSTTTTVAP